MTFLEKLIKEYLKSQGLILLEGTIESVAQYIEQQNECSDELYTVRDWVKDTLENYPKQLIRRKILIERCVNYFVEQREMCLNQTGRLPCMEDYIGAAESEDFRDKVGYPVTLVTVFEALMDYYCEEQE